MRSSGFEILGVTTNLSFLTALVDDDAFRAGRLDTGFIDRELPRLAAARPLPAAAAAAAAWQAATAGTAPASGDGQPINRSDPFDTIRGWRG